MAAHTYLAKVIKNEKSEMDKTEVQAEEVEEGRDSPGTPESREDLSSSRSRKNHWSVMEKLESKNRHGKVEMVNQVGKWGFVAINVMSNLIIGLVAMVERFKEPNEYVEAGYEMI